MDEFVDDLLTKERVCDVILPRLTKREVLEDTEGLKKRKSTLVRSPSMRNTWSRTDVRPIGIRNERPGRGRRVHVPAQTSTFHIRITRLPIPFPIPLAIKITTLHVALTVTITLTLPGAYQAWITLAVPLAFAV